MKKSNKKILRNRKKIVSLSTMNKKIHSPVIAASKNKALNPVTYKSTGGNYVEVSYNKSTELDTCFKNLGGELKVTLEKRFKSKFPLNQMWDCVQFRMVNPTSIPCAFNLFDGFSITPVPNTPNGYVPILNPIGIPVMNFPPSAGTTYPSFECAVVVEPPAPAGASNYATVYVPSTDRIYVCDDRFVQVINPNTNTVVNTIGLPHVNQGGNQALFNPIMNRVYISSFNSGIIDIIDCATETMLPSFFSSSGNNIISMSFNPTNNTIYNAMGVDGNIEVLNCATNIGGVFISLSGTVSGVVVWVNGLNTYALALNSTNNTFYYINAAINTIISSFVTALNCTGFGRGNSVIYNSVNNSVYYIDFARTQIVELSIATFLVNGSVACNQSTSLLYISNYNVLYFDDFSTAPQIKIVDCSTNTISNTVPVSLTLGAAPQIMGQLSYDTSNNSVWVTRNFGGSAQEQVSKLCGTNAMCYIVGSEDYNEFCQDLRNNPICVRQFQIFAQSAGQVSVPLNLQTKDASGNLCTIPKLPNITISVDQFQPNIATVDFNCKDLILDCLTTINQYTIAPNSEVNVVIYYKQVRKVDILTSKITVCKRLTEPKCPDGDSRTEKQLQFQSPRPHVRPKWMKPFSSSMITNGSGSGSGTDGNKNLNIGELGRPAFNLTLTPIVTPMKNLSMKQVKRLDKSNLGKLTDEIDKPVKSRFDNYYKSSVEKFDSDYGVKDKAPAESFSNKENLNNSKKVKKKSVRGRRK